MEALVKEDDKMLFQKDYKEKSIKCLSVNKMEFTAIIRKGEKQFVALCPEVDVVSQGHTIEKALENLKEAVSLYVDEMGLPKEFKSQEAIVTHFALSKNAKAA